MKDKCPSCNTKIDPLEIYTDWFYCKVCDNDFEYHRDRLSPEDQISGIPGQLISDSRIPTDK